MKVLAFDVGVRNLAFVAMAGDRSVLAWENCAVGGATLEEHVRAVHALLGNRPALLRNLDAVLIERQPPLNRKMSCVAYALFMFFLAKAPVVQFVDPKTKTSGFADFLTCRESPLVTKANAYRVRKAECVACVRHSLRDSPWLRVLEEASKKDDLADAYASAYSWLARQPVRV